MSVKEEKEPWVEKPEWQPLRQHGALVISLQHVCTDACTYETCCNFRNEKKDEVGI